MTVRSFFARFTTQAAPVQAVAPTVPALVKAVGDAFLAPASLRPRAEAAVGQTLDVLPFCTPDGKVNVLAAVLTDLLRLRTDITNQNKLKGIVKTWTPPADVPPAAPVVIKGGDWTKYTQLDGPDEIWVPEGVAPP